MRLNQALGEVAELTPERLDDVRRHVPTEWIGEALQATGTATVRKRRLPAIQVIWLVIGMALFRNRSIRDVVDKLDLALPGRSLTVANSAIPQARARLGSEPLQWLFQRCAEQWAHASAAADCWRELALYSVDGSTLRVADSDDNRTYFGGTRGSRGDSGYPLVRLVALMALRSHLLAAVTFGPYATGEQTYAAELWPAVPNQSLLIVDKGFFAAKLLIPLARDGKGRHWLTRGKKNLRWEVIERRGRGNRDLIVEMKVSPQARAQDETLPKTWRVRVITYRIKGYRPQVLLTSLLDADQYPAEEVIALYHERWEIELGYGEIKTDLLEQRSTLRSKSPTAVEQELWGVLLAYNLVRLEIEQAAKQAGVAPTRISFVVALRMIIDEWLWLAIASPGTIPARLRELRANLAAFILPPRRPERRYPRAVKIKMSNYARKRPARRPENRKIH